MKTLVAFALVCLCFQLFAQQHPVFTLKEQKIDSVLSNAYPDSLPGMSIAILQQGKAVFKKGYGISNTTTKNKLTDSSNFNICSLTKQFTAIAILQLQQKHLLSLNDKLSNFFPEMNKKLSEAITVKQLLTHTSGIPDHYSYTNTTSMQHAHNSDVYNAIKNVDTTYFTPGAKFRYSNTAYCLLALIIEKFSGKTYNDYMTENVFKPAGMQHTMLWNEHATIPNEVTAYERDSMHNLIPSAQQKTYSFQLKVMAAFIHRLMITFNGLSYYRQVMCLIQKLLMKHAAFNSLLIKTKQQVTVLAGSLMSRMFNAKYITAVIMAVSKHTASVYLL